MAENDNQNYFTSNGQDYSVGQAPYTKEIIDPNSARGKLYAAMAESKRVANYALKAGKALDDIARQILGEEDYNRMQEEVTASVAQEEKDKRDLDRYLGLSEEQEKHTFRM